MTIKLVENANDINEMVELANWLYSSPRFTMGPVTEEFEKKFADYIGTKYCVMVNSGSSANLLAVASLKHYIPNHYHFVVVPALSWATTISPYMQLGEFTTILCDCNMDNLGLDINHLKQLIDQYHPTIIQTVNVLGFPNDYEEIKQLCNENQITLIEDSCETLGSTYNKIKCGNFGLMSTFSFFYGHIISTIEGGMICTSDADLNILLRMLRAHGWTRNIDEITQRNYREKYDVSKFQEFYNFYYPAFNIRPMEIQSFLGLKQLEKIDNIIEKRTKNYELYDSNLTNVKWKPKFDKNCVNFAYPLLVENRDRIIESLTKNNIECRPIICGSINQQPFYKEWKYKKDTETPNADRIHKYGLYVPNHPLLKEDDILRICDIINEGVK